MTNYVCFNISINIDIYIFIFIFINNLYFVNMNMILKKKRGKKIDQSLSFVNMCEILKKKKKEKIIDQSLESYFSFSINIDKM